MQNKRQQWAYAVLSLIICVSSEASAFGFETATKVTIPDRGGGKSKREAFSRSCEFNQKGVALEEQGKAKEAVEQFKMAIATYPHYSVHYCNYGNALADLKRYDEAIVQYRKAVELSPDFAAAYSNMADAMAKQKDYMGAELACKSAIRVDPGYVPAMTNLAEVYIETNRPHDAVTVLKKAGGLTITSGMKKIIEDNLEKANEMLGASTKVQKYY